MKQTRRGASGASGKRKEGPQSGDVVRYAGSIFCETYSGDGDDIGDNIGIDVGDGKMLLIGMNHWDQQEWCVVGFKGARSAWNAAVERVTIKLSVKTSDTPSEYVPFNLNGMDIGLTFAFDPTHPALKWQDKAGMSLNVPGFSFPVPGGYTNVSINDDWHVEATVELKSA